MEHSRERAGESVRVRVDFRGPGDFGIACAKRLIGDHTRSAMEIEDRSGRTRIMWC